MAVARSTGLPQSSNSPRRGRQCVLCRAITLARRDWLLLLFLAIAYCHGPLLSAQAEDVQLQLTPNPVQLAAGDSAQVIAILRNNSGAALRDLEVHWSSDLAIKVDPQSSMPQEVKSKSALAWPIKISQSVPGRNVGAIQFWVSYSTSEKEGTIPGVAAASMQVQELTPLDIDKLVTVKLESAVDELDEHHAAQLYLVVTNSSAVPVTVTRIVPYGPDFLTLNANSASNTVLEPQTSRTFPVTAKVGDQAAPGNYRVVLAIDLSWTDGGKPRTGAVATAQTLPVSILGQSEILKLMGVPSFLLLPGFLALATFGFLWARIAPKKKILDPLSVEEKALLAVSLSFLTAFVYPFLAHGRNYLNGYGLRDVVWVWFGSIGFAMAAWIVASGSRAMYARAQRLKAERQARADADAVNRRMPTKNDSPSKMLDRMQANHVGLPPHQVKVKLGSAQKARAFLVVPAGGPITESWVVPPIALIPDPAGTTWTHDQVATELGKDATMADAASLAKFLGEAEKVGWKAQWGASDVIIGPTPIGVNDKEDAPAAPGFNFVDPA